MKPKISIVTLGVSDFQKSFDFYTKGLGFTPNNYKEGEAYALFEMQGTWFSIFPIDLLSKDVGIDCVISASQSIILEHNVESESKVDEVVQHGISVGGKLVKQPQKAVWGGYSGYFADPDGYLWAVAYNPFTDLTYKSL